MLSKEVLCETVLRIIRETIEAKELDSSKVALDSPVDGRLGLDSLDWATVVVRLEMETGIDPFARGVASELKTVSDLVDLYITAAGQ